MGKLADGSRCQAKSMIELDHDVLWSRGGEMQLGADFMESKRARQASDLRV